MPAPPGHDGAMAVQDLVLHDAATYDHGFPYEHFRELRRDHPITHHEHPAWERGYWAVVRHADVVRVSRDSNFKTSPHPMLETASDDDAAGLTELLISKDPPEHTRLRKLISAGFTPRRVADLTDRIRDRVASLIDSVAE